MKVNKSIAILATCSCTLYATSANAADACDGFWDAYPGAEVVTITFPESPNKPNNFSTYEIGFISHSGNQWTYGVCEKSGKNLSHWTLSMPSCVTSGSEHHISSYTPSAGGDIDSVDIGPDPSINNQDPNANLIGIKWNTAGSFSSGVFTIILDDNYAEGSIDVAAKAGNPQVDGGTRYGFEIASLTGPDCSHVNKLDVDILSFTANATGNGTKVKWRTANEKDVIAFELVRAIPKDGQNCTPNREDYEETSLTHLTMGQPIYAEGDEMTGKPEEYQYPDKFIPADDTTYCYGLFSLETENNAYVYKLLDVTARQ